MCVFVQLLKMVSLRNNDPFESNLVAKLLANSYGKRIKFEKQIGEGSYGCVFSGTMKGEPKAIKIIKKEFVKLKPDQFWKELKTVDKLLRINHPNIVNFTEILFIRSTMAWIIMEYYENSMDLFQFLFDNDIFLTEKQARLIYKQIVEGLKYLHSAEICHRDLKAENILIIDKNPQNAIVKLIDFGFSTELKRSKDNSYELCSSWLGTPEFVSPEVLEKKPYDGFMLDVWGSGVLLFLMVNRKYPFQGDPDAHDYIEQLTYQIRQMNLNWEDRNSNSFKSIVLHILEPESHKRYTLTDILKHDWLGKNKTEQ